MNFSLVLIIFSLLVVNVSTPWTTFWMEFVAAVGLFSAIIFLFFKDSIRFQKNIAIAITVALIILSIDYFFRKNAYVGDYFIVALYFYIFSISISLGFIEKLDIERYAIFSIFAAIFCIGIALCQWLGVELDKMYFREIPLGSRVYANMGQPNHLGTILVWSGIFTILLNNNKTISNFLTVIILIIISFSQALTQSRTSFLSLLVIFFISSFIYKKDEKSIALKNIGLWIICVIGFSVMLPFFQKFLEIGAERNIYEMGVGTSRTSHWISMLEAVAKEPLLGYGWLHAAEAQIRGTEYSIKESIFQYSHNLIIDVTLWAGIPFGIFVLFGIFYSIVCCLKNPLSINQKYTFLLVLVFLTHCMLEFPYAYLHLLIPAGIFIGYCFRGKKSNENKLSRVGSFIIIFFGVFGGVFFVYEYWIIEGEATDLRFEYAKIHSTEPAVIISDVILLDQVKALVENTYREPVNNINSVKIKDFEKSAYRYGTQRLLLHTAMVHGFNNDQSTSKKFLREICKIHSKSSCEYSKNQWNILKNDYPESIGKINFPEN